MYRGKSGRIFPIIVVILVVAIIIVAIVSIGRAFFGGSSSNDQKLDESQSALLDTSGASHVQLSMRGPIVAQENFRSYQIDISPTSRNITTYTGYQGQRLDSRQLGNNTTAYEEFVYALNREDFMKGDQLKDEANDIRGICPTGRVYSMAVMRGDRTVKQLWTSSCSGARGSFRANLDRVRSLFQRQIPDSDRLIQTIAF